MSQIRYKPYLIFLGLLALGVLILLLISWGYYPIAIVNGQVITAQQFNQGYQVATNYSDAFSKVYGIDATSSIALDESPSATQLDVLNELIQNSLVHQSLVKDLGGDYDTLVSERVAQYDDNTTLQAASEAIFGLSYNDFKQSFLVPETEREVMSGRLFLQGQNIDDWLTQQEKSAHVVIFSSEFHWDGQEAAMNGS